MMISRLLDNLHTPVGATVVDDQHFIGEGKVLIERRKQRTPDGCLRIEDRNGNGNGEISHNR